MFAVIIWSLLQLGLFWALVRFCVRVLGFRPSARLFEGPHHMLLPVLAHAAIAVGMVLLLQRILGVEEFARSPWFSSGDTTAIVGCVALGMLPAGADLVLASACRHRRILIRPRAGVYPGGVLLALGVALLSTAFVEELVFRSVPLGLLGGDRLALAYLIPTVAFAAIHFLETRRPRGIYRHVHLFTGALFFFVVALRCGLVAATCAHAASNLSVVMIEGNWRLGSLLKIDRPQDSERYLHNSIGYALGTLAVML